MSKRKDDEEDAIFIDNLPHTVTLKYPVQIGKETLSEITFERRPTAGDIKMQGQDSTFDDTLKILSKITGQPISTIHRLDASDSLYLSKIVNGFLTVGPRTGNS